MSMKRLFFGTLLFISCNYKKEFHIRVRQYYKDKVCIEFTNNNWFTKDELMDAFDLSDAYVNPDWVVHQIWLTSNCQEAVNVASKLTSYEKCLQWNIETELKYDSLVAYRNAHPIKKVTKQDNQPECKEVDIY